MNVRRTLLVDDHALFREGLAGLLGHQSDFAVVGEAGDAQSALAQALTLRPDLVLMDIDMPGEDGVVATRWIKAAVPETTVVMLTVHEDGEKLLDAVKSGAQGYLVKNIRTTELLAQLRRLGAGEPVISRRIAARILQEFRGGEDVADGEPNLTTREIEVLQLVTDRLSNSDIAERLTISEHTVKNHLKNILAKLHVRNRRQAAALGLIHGWVRVEPPSP